LGSNVQNVYGLAAVMGPRWSGGWVNASKLPTLLARGRPFIAQMYHWASESSHYIAVMGQSNGELLIEDPWGGGSTYRMAMQEFLQFWTLYGVFYE
jgi:hypothetical protein